MPFPPKIPCPGCGKLIGVHIFFKSYFCYTCNTQIPLTRTEYESCLRTIPADGKRSLVPPERESKTEPAPDIPLPTFSRPFPLEMPRPEHRPLNPDWSGVYFPGDFVKTKPKRQKVMDIEELEALSPPETKPQQLTNEEAKDYFIKRLREKCGRKLTLG